MAILRKFVVPQVKKWLQFFGLPVETVFSIEPIPTITERATGTGTQSPIQIEEASTHSTNTIWNEFLNATHVRADR
jgi:hypothetical protein